MIRAISRFGSLQEVQVCSRIEILDYSIIILLLHLDNGLIQIKIIIILIFEFFQIIVSEQDFNRVLDGDGYPVSSLTSHPKAIKKFWE